MRTQHNCAPPGPQIKSTAGCPSEQPVMTVVAGVKCRFSPYTSFLLVFNASVAVFNGANRASGGAGTTKKSKKRQHSALFFLVSARWRLCSRRAAWLLPPSTWLLLARTNLCWLFSRRSISASY